MNDLDLRLEVV